jgi:hypothetical protein
MPIVTFVGVWTPLVMKAAEAIHDAREAFTLTPTLSHPIDRLRAGKGRGRKKQARAWWNHEIRNSSINSATVTMRVATISLA